MTLTTVDNRTRRATGNGTAGSFAAEQKTPGAMTLAPERARRAAPLIDPAKLKALGRKFRRIAIAGTTVTVAGLILTGCGMAHGTITKKTDVPAHIITTISCANKSCHPVFIPVPESYRFDMVDKNEKGEPETGSRSVSAEEYKTYEVGEYYSEDSHR